MAQTNYTPIALYNSTTAAAVPLAANLVNGELAINITDGKLYYKDNGGVVQAIGYKVVPYTAGGTGLTAAPTNGQIPIGTGSGYALSTITAGSGVSITNASGSITIAATGSGGTVTSVGLSAPALFTVTNSPVTGSGTLTLSYSGTALPIANGGTNSTATPTAGGAGYGTGTAHAYTAAGTAGQVLTSNGASAPTWSTPAAGTAIGLVRAISINCILC